MISIDRILPSEEVITDKVIVKLFPTNGIGRGRGDTTLLEIEDICDLEANCINRYNMMIKEEYVRL